MTEEAKVEETKWVIRVTTLINADPVQYKNFFIGVQGDEEQAQHMLRVIGKKGFKVGGQRFFSDAIKNLTIKKDGEILNEQ